LPAVSPFTTAGEVVEGYETLKKLASSRDHIVPGHDPLVLARYPAAHVVGDREDAPALQMRIEVRGVGCEHDVAPPRLPPHASVLSDGGGGPRLRSCGSSRRRPQVTAAAVLCDPSRMSDEARAVLNMW
jgi:hypothetical protein